MFSQASRGIPSKTIKPWPIRQEHHQKINWSGREIKSHRTERDIYGYFPKVDQWDPSSVNSEKQITSTHAPGSQKTVTPLPRQQTITYIRYSHETDSPGEKTEMGISLTNAMDELHISSKTNPPPCPYSPTWASKTGADSSQATRP